MERCKECGGKLRVVDARRLLRECERCGVKVTGPEEEAGGHMRPTGLTGPAP